MRERGFMPFSLVGAVLIVIVLGMVGHSIHVKHNRTTEFIEGGGISELGKLVEEVQSNLKASLGRSVSRALVDVGGESSSYLMKTWRIIAIGAKAGEYFREELKRLADSLDNRVELQVPGNPIVLIAEADNGYIKAMSLMRGTKLELASWDNSVRAEVELERVETFVYSRYFLLENLMKDFLEKKGDVCATWQLLEYVRGYAEAWVGGKVHLNDSIDEAVFRASWALHEYNSFGSFDYWGTAGSIVDSAKEILTGKRVAVSPIKGSDIEEMKNLVEGAIDALEAADSSLEDLLGKISDARGSISENLPVENVRAILETVRGEAEDARSEVFGIKTKFDKLLEHVARRSAGDAMMKFLHSGLTSRTLSPDLPSPDEQIGWGVDWIYGRVSEIENEIRGVSVNVSGNIDGVLKKAGDVVGALRRQAEVKAWAKVKSYTKDPPAEVENLVPVYVTESSGGEMGSLKTVLAGLVANLDEMGGLPEKLDAEDIGEIEWLDEWFREKLDEVLPVTSIDRENLYRISPPSPVNQDPGISVYNEIDVGEIRHTRGDIFGRLNSPSATPIPLPFLNICLYWGQWETVVELEGAVEEIFDYENPTIVQPSEIGYLHSPLAYRWEMPGENMGINVVVISLRNFTIG